VRKLLWLAFVAVVTLVAAPAFAQDVDAAPPTLDGGVEDAVAPAPPASTAVLAPTVPTSADAAVAAPTEPPEGVAAPATAAGTTLFGVSVRPGLEVIAQYAYRTTYDAGGNSDWFHLFDVPRVHGSLGAAYGPALGRVVLEGVRSASEGSLMGVAGDSVVLRVREAWAGVKWPENAGADGLRLEAQAGVVPTLTIPELEGTWMLRPVSATPLESTGLAAPADLGATVRFAFPRRYGFVGVGAYDGEGYTNRELNRGKNFEGAAVVHPLASVDVLRPFAVFGSMVLGSSGTGLSRANRATGGLLWQGKRVRAGVTFTYGWGLRDDGNQTGYLLDVFARVEPIDRLLVGARVFHWNRDTRPGDANTVSTVIASVGYRIFDPLEAFLAFDRSLPSTSAQVGLPGTDYWSLRVIGHVVF